MRILGVDTATSIASVALIDDEALLAEEVYGADVPAQAKKNHAEIILPLIQSVLSSGRFTLGDLSGIAVSIGPGSFTGLRIGLATVKGLAFSSGLPTVGVSTLLAMAATAADFDGTICSLLDARKHEVYFGMFRRLEKRLVAIGGESVVSILTAVEALRAHVSAGAQVLAVGDGAKAYDKILREALDGGLTLTQKNTSSVAAQVAFLARARLADSPSDNVGALTPVYLRRPEAESRKLTPSR